MCVTYLFSSPCTFCPKHRWQMSLNGESLLCSSRPSPHDVRPREKGLLWSVPVATDNQCRFKHFTRQALKHALTCYLPTLCQLRICLGLVGLRMPDYPQFYLRLREHTLTLTPRHNFRSGESSPKTTLNFQPTFRTGE